MLSSMVSMNNIMNANRIDILFFERPLVDLKKFAFKIANKLKLIDPQIKLGAIAIELPDKTDRNDIDHFYYRHDIKDIDKFLIESEVKIIVFTQTRIPDLEFILHAKKLGLKTIMLQEGVMFDGMNINDVSGENAIAILSYLPKVFEYLNILRRMCKYDNRSFFSVIWHFLKKKKNVTITLANEFSSHLIGDYIFTMGEYWSDYYINTHGYDKKQIRLIGDHDLDGFKPENNNEKAICYIANVLVEDGTVKRSVFEKFLNILSVAIDKTTRFYIKLHPRSDKSLYDIFKDHNVVFIRNGKLPSVTLYIGHRSALLGRALYESDNLIIWRFACEQVCFYEKYATATCTEGNEFIKAVQSIDITRHTNNKLEKISRVYWNNPNGSMFTAANMIYKYMNNQLI